MTRRQELASLIRLIDEFGPEHLWLHRPALPLTTRDRINLRDAVVADAIAWHEDRQLTRSTRCHASPDLAHEPVAPYWSPPNLPRQSRIAVIGPAPDYRDHQHGELGYGKADRTLARVLRDAGIPASSVSWLSACWCWCAGSTDPRVTTNRSPTVTELDVWHTLTMRALEAADVSYVLLHGSHAMRAWRSDWKITDLAGGLYTWNERMFVTPLPHTTAVTRPDGFPMSDWRRMVADFAHNVLEDVGMTGLGSRCRKCAAGTAFYAWDQDGIPLCRRHFEELHSKGQRAQQNAARKAQLSGQGAML